MAALTWRDVAAPDFGTSLQGINQFSRLLGNAFQGAEQAVGKFDNAQDEMANRAILERSLAMRDPNAYEAALADGSILGSDKFRASGATLSGLDARVGTLQNQALGKINLEQTGRQNDQAKALDAAGSAAIEYQRLARDPSVAGQARAQAFLEANPVLTDTGALGYRNALGISNGAFTNEGIGLERSNVRQNMDLAMRGENRSQTMFDRGTVEYAENRAVQRLAEDAFAQGFDGSNIDAYMAANGIEGNLKAQLRGAMGGYSGFGSGGGGGATGSASDPMSVMNYQARGGGFGAVPASVKTMGDASRYADSINAAGIPSSAMGPYQIVGNTRDNTAKKLFGSGWKNMPYSLENETRIATDIFNSNKGSADALRKQWVSLTPAEAERVRKMPAPDALAFIARKESGATPAQLRGGAAVGTQQAKQRTMMEDPNNFASQVNKAREDQNSSLIDVAGSLAKSLGASKDDVFQQLQAIQAEGDKRKIPVNPAVAAVIYKNSLAGTNWLGATARSWFDNTSAGGKQYVDSKMVGANLDAVGNTIQGTLISRDQIAATEAAKAQARSRFDAATNRVLQLQQAQENGRPINPAVMAKARNDRARAQALLEDTINGQITSNERDAEATGINMTGRAALDGPKGRARSVVAPGGYDVIGTGVSAVNPALGAIYKGARWLLGD